MSTNLDLHTAELRVQDRVGSPGAQPPSRHSKQMGISSLSKLPCKLILNILDGLLPVGPHTTAQSVAENPVVSSGQLECRTSLFNLCLTSKTFYELAIPHLYRSPLVKTNRELFRFFCALAKHADRRPMVRSFAWAGVMLEDQAPVRNFNEPWPLVEERILKNQAAAQAISAEFWDFVGDDWPRDNIDFAIAEYCEYHTHDMDLAWISIPEAGDALASSSLKTSEGFELRIPSCFVKATDSLLAVNNGWGPTDLEDPRLLASVLAICPRIKCLFIMNGAQLYLGNYSCPELATIQAFFEESQTENARDCMDRIELAHGHPLLHGLETFAVEGHSLSNTEASCDTLVFLAMVFENLGSLRRVELKYPPPFKELLDEFEFEIPLTAGVNEVSLLFAQHPQDDMAAIVACFPNLTSLHAEFRDGSDRHPDTFDLPPEVSEALLEVSETLETLSLTTSPETYPAEGHWVRFESYPPSLSTLNEMSKLQDLTTESIWLFGTENPAVALQLPHLLPQSLVRLHLIDYWGNSDPAEFYPEFVDSCTPLEFYFRVFVILCYEASKSLPELKEVTFSSKYFDSNFQPRLLNAGQAEEGETAITDGLMQSVRRTFDRVGITFRIILRGTEI